MLPLAMRRVPSRLTRPTTSPACLRWVTSIGGRSHARACGTILTTLAFGALAACTDAAPTRPADATTTPVTSVGVGDRTIAVGEKIAFVAPSFGPDASIFAMNTDGSEIRRLTDGTLDNAPSWSPNYKSIVFTRGSGGSGGNPEIMMMNANGRRQRVIGVGHDPVWSPDGSKIAYWAIINGNADIYVMNPDGSGVTRLTTAAGIDLGPSWSPDGLRIAFSSDRLGGKKEIFVMTADGSNPTKLTNCTAENANCGDVDWHPSPGDDRLVFTIFLPVGELRTINADGTGLATVLNELATGASWSRDGSRIAVAKQAPGEVGVDVFSVRPDGTGLTRLTLDANRNANPAWSR